MLRILGLSKACPTRSCRLRDPEPYTSKSQSLYYPPPPEAHVPGAIVVMRLKRAYSSIELVTKKPHLIGLVLNSSGLVIIR